MKLPLLFGLPLGHRRLLLPHVESVVVEEEVVVVLKSLVPASLDSIGVQTVPSLRATS